MHLYSTGNMMRSPPASLLGSYSNSTGDNNIIDNNDILNDCNNSETLDDPDNKDNKNKNKTKRNRGRARKGSTDENAEVDVTDLVGQMKLVFLKNEKKAIAREIIMRDDISKIKSDIGNLIEFKFEEHLAVMNEKIVAVSTSLSTGIEKNSKDIIEVNERLDNLEAQVNEATTSITTNNEQFNLIKPVLNLENEILDRLDRQSNLLFHGVPEVNTLGLSGNERAKLDHGKIKSIIKNICPGWDNIDGKVVLSFRLSQFSPSRINPRLIKVRFCNNIIRDEFKLCFIECKKSSTLQQEQWNVRNLTISDDLTQIQLKQLNLLKDQLRLPENLNKTMKMVKGKYLLVNKRANTRQQQQEQPQQ